MHKQLAKSVRPKHIGCALKSTRLWQIEFAAVIDGNPCYPFQVLPFSGKILMYQAH